MIDHLNNKKLRASYVKVEIFKSSIKTPNVFNIFSAFS